MKLQTAVALVKGGRLGLLWRTNALFSPFYRLSFVAAASSAGLLGLLSSGPRSLAEVATGLGVGPDGHAGLAAWLGLGVRLGELALDDQGYRLVGFLARRLADPAHDPVAALALEVASFHHRLIFETPARLAAGRPWRIEEHDGELIARSSRILEPFVFPFVDEFVPARGAVRLLEVACGSGTYLRRAAQRNPELSALGVELQAEVAEAARRLIAAEGLAGRVTIESGDIRAREGDASFDLVTLHNAIYYFPTHERAALFARLGAFLRPGGRLVVCSSCRGGSPGMQLLDVWTSSVAGFGPLPSEDELAAQLREAGFARVESRRLVPGEPYVGMIATVAGGDRRLAEGGA